MTAQYMDISVIGIGAMGTAVVERLLATGHRVIIYNRTTERMAPLAEKGAHITDSARAAVEATALTISLVEHAPAMDEAILTDEIVPLFSDKVFMKMTTTNGRVARRVADRYCVLDKGRAVAHGAIDELTDDLVKRYLTV